MIDEKNSKYKFKEYFYPELKSYLKSQIMEEYTNDFEDKRRIGENDSYICELIRNDLVKDFIIYVKTNFYKETKINTSLYETNQLLLNNNPTLIEYAAFYGSIRIFQYLYMNQAKLKQSLWIYAIHGSNAEMIHFLEENKFNQVKSHMKNVLKNQ